MSMFGPWKGYDQWNVSFPICGSNLLLSGVEIRHPDSMHSAHKPQNVHMSDAIHAAIAYAPWIQNDNPIHILCNL